MKYLLWLLLLPSIASAANWWVSPVGSDSNAGTSSGAPFATFAKAVSNLTAGDTLNVACGTYQQPLVDSTKSGSNGSPITIQAVTAGCATITNVGSSGIGILLANVSWVIISGVNVNGGQALDFANTNAAIGCLPASFAGGAAGSPNVGEWAEIDNSAHVTLQNATFQYARGYAGVFITGRHFANGSPASAGIGTALDGTSSFVTLQNLVIDHDGNLLDRTQTCGDAVNVRFGSIDHLLIQNSIITHGSHNTIQFGGGGTVAITNSIIQNNLLDNSWSDLYATPIFNNMRNGYRVVDLDGSNNLIQGNLFEHAGCCNAAPSFISPIVQLHGQKNLLRRNVLWDGIFSGLAQNCGYSGYNDVEFNHIVHNTLVGLDNYAFSFEAFSGTPGCTRDGNHVFVNNLAVNTRQNPSAGAKYVPSFDADIMHVLSGAASGYVNVGLGPIGSNTYLTNLFAPSLTAPSTFATRPAAFWNYFNTGQTPICLTQSGSGVCPNTSPAQTVFSPKVANNIDAGQTPSSIPTFVSAIPATTARGVYANFALAAGSAGIDQGQCLTTTTSGATSTSIPVADVNFFTDGMSLITGDLIQLCTHGTTATVTAITPGTYPAGTLTVTPSVTFSNGEGVTLAYSGTAPDIGAIEGTAAVGGVVPVVSPKTWNGFYCAITGKVVTDPSHCH